MANPIFETPMYRVEMIGFGLRITFLTVPNEPWVLIQSIQEMKDLSAFIGACAFAFDFKQRSNDDE